MRRSNLSNKELVWSTLLSLSRALRSVNIPNWIFSAALPFSVGRRQEINYSLIKVVVEAVKGLFGEEKEECLMESLSTIIGCCDGEKAQC